MSLILWLIQKFEGEGCNGINASFVEEFNFSYRALDFLLMMILKLTTKKAMWIGIRQQKIKLIY